MTIPHSTSLIGAAAACLLAATTGCSQAQNAPAQAPQAPMIAMPQPEAPVAPPIPVEPAPFASTVWRAGQNGTLLLSGTMAGYAGPLAVVDYEGRAVWSGTAAPGTTRVEIPVSALGLYSLRAGDKKISFAVVPAPRTTALPLAKRMIIGLNTHFGPRDAPEQAFALLQAAGVEAVRDEIGWAPIEKEKGVFSFLPRHAEYTAKLKAHGIGLWWSASYGNPLYPQTGGRYPAAEAAAPYSRYVVETLKKFGGNIIGVEVLNEPNKVDPVKDYLPVLRATRQAVRAAGFKQPIVAVGGAGPAGGGMAPGFARALFKAGGAPFADGFSQHPYMTPFTPDSGYGAGQSNLDAALTRAGDVVSDYKLGGSWITELGWPALQSDAQPSEEEKNSPRGTKPMVSEPKQAAFVARTLLGASKYPHLRGLFFYDFQDDGPIPTRREHRFGLVRQDLQPKMGFQAFAIAQDFLRDKTFVSRVFAPDSHLTANIYRDTQGQTWAAVWSLEATRAELAEQAKGTRLLPERHMELEYRVPFRIKGATAQSGHDWQGRSVEIKPVMTAASLPVYLQLGRTQDEVSVEIVPGPNPTASAGAD